MTKENRNNLIFLVTLVVLSAPGLIILVTKALNGTGGLTATPPSKKVRTAYLNPVGGEAGLIRLVPPVTLAFVDKVAQEHAGGLPERGSAAGGRPVPTVSAGRRIEWLRQDSVDGAYMLLWLRARSEGPVDKVEADVDGRPIAAEVVVELDVDEAVRKELQEGSGGRSALGYSGYANPPRRVAVVRLATPSIEGQPVELRWRRDEVTQEDVIVAPPTRPMTRPAPADTTAS
jgi:hypothetical protein